MGMGMGRPWRCRCGLTRVSPAGRAGAVSLRRPSPRPPGVAGEARRVLPAPQDGLLRRGGGGSVGGWGAHPARGWRFWPGGIARPAERRAGRGGGGGAGVGPRGLD